MTQYLVAIHHPDDFDPSSESEATVRAIDVLNEEMAAAGVVVFVGGLTSVRDAQSLRAQPEWQGARSPTGRTWRPRSTSAVSGCWKPPLSRMHWRGGARLLSPVERRWKCARLGCRPPEGRQRGWPATPAISRPQSELQFPGPDWPGADHLDATG